MERMVSDLEGGLKEQRASEEIASDDLASNLEPGSPLLHQIREDDEDEDLSPEDAKRFIRVA